MINIEDINYEKWKGILHTNSPDDLGMILFLCTNEEKILNRIIDNSHEMSLKEKRKEYIKKILEENSLKDNIDCVVSKIEEIRKAFNYSVLQFGKRLPGTSYIVFEFGDKVIKFGKYYKVINDENILQPEMQIRFGNNENAMTVYERVSKVFTKDDKNVAREMYYRVRDNGILWFDPLGYNIGKTNNLRNKKDDGLRIIDAEYLEYEQEVLRRINPKEDEKYKNLGVNMYDIALRDYICQNGVIDFENKYQDMKNIRKIFIIKSDIESVAKQSCIDGIKGVKDFFSGIFKRKEEASLNEK